MIELLRGIVPQALWPVVFVAIFLVIGGGALYLTPRVAGWQDRKARENPGYFDGMREKTPDASAKEENGVKEGEK